MSKYEKDNIERLRPHLAECTVLLRKDGEFPLDGPCRIAAIGPGARNTIKGGTGSGEVNSRYFVNIIDGLRAAGFDVAGDEWADAYSKYEENARAAFREGIRERAKKEKLNPIAASMGAVMKAPEYDIPVVTGCDAAVYVVSRISGEGNDRLPEKGDYLLTDSEVRDILELDRIYKKFMLVINAGGPVDLSPVMGVGNILVLSQLGVETGSALADIILGKEVPSGKLTTTWAKYSDYGIRDFGGRDETRYTEGLYVGYRWFDALRTKPLFPFGFGLGYTDFALSIGSIEISGASVTVNVNVTNTGTYKGRETVQVYVSCPAGRLGREIKSLAGFAKTSELEPGGSETVRASFDMRDLAAFDDRGARWVLEAGDYILLTGADSAEARPAAVLRLEYDTVVLQTVTRFGGPVSFEWRPDKGREFASDGLPVYIMDEKSLHMDVVSTLGKGVEYAEAAAAAKLTDEELALLGIGAFKKNAILPSVVGDSAMAVAGAAGETCGLFNDRGIGNIIMADGPAGVRIASRYYEDSKGRHSVGGVIPESVIEMLPSPAGKLLAGTGRRRLKGKTIHEQYCTAIPIGTAIAQSFNVEFAEMCGDLVAGEMELFGVDIWLAPALNIHRDVLCGRNFEYYSEDPLLSGLIAAAVTRGVQKHPGCGVTIKHFAANNQETNRYANSSIIGERTLREIYLKAFGICIRHADPMCLMTSYNLLNGKHTSESRALTTGILREEFGFDGLVMTDWVIGGYLLLAGGSKYGVPDPAEVSAAGSSLFMPGGRKDYKALLRGLADGRVTREQLMENAGWLIHVMERLGRQQQSRTL